MLAASASAAFGALVLAACGGDDEVGSAPDKTGLISKPVDTSKQAKRGGVSKFYFGSESAAFDIHLGGAAPLNVPRSMVYSDFISEKPGYLGPPEYKEYIPDLAESWEWSPDGLQLTFKLRPGVKWHNKPPINARLLDMEDVLFTWKRYEGIGRYRRDILNSANPSAPILSVFSPDSRNFVLKLKEPSVDLLAHLSIAFQGKPSIIPKETDSRFDIRRDMIGTGPWVLSNYTPSVGMTYARNQDYWEKDRPRIDQIEAPFVIEYAQQLAQFRAGNVYTGAAVRQEDVIRTKQEVPELKMYTTAPPGSFSPGVTVFFGWTPVAENTAFKDERVRQALSMSLDRDLYIDTFYNVEKFRSQGLPVETKWHAVFGAGSGAWMLDPRSKDFGANARYYMKDITEAKRLLAAAGYANGLPVISNYISGRQLGTDHQKQIQVLEQMAAEAGFQPSANLIDYVSEYPKFRDGRGKFTGWAYVSTPAPGNDAVTLLNYRYYSKGGVNFLGFDVAGKGDDSGDPAVDSQIEKARREFDIEKRKSIVYDLQRYLAKAQYCIPNPGVASGFTLAWPVLGNFQAFQGEKRGVNFDWWIDDAQPPLKKA